MAVSSKLEAWFINGVIITIPLVITLMLLLIVMNFILSVLQPLTDAIALIWQDEPSDAMIQSITVASMIGLLFAIGIIADYTPGSSLSRTMDGVVATVPLLSTVYAAVQQASRILVDDTSEQFRDVKLIEFPKEGSFMVGFVTGRPPDAIVGVARSPDLITVMVPLAPNPATNGIILHVRADQVYDVDLTVEQAIQSIVTLGVATNDGGTIAE